MNIKPLIIFDSEYTAWEGSRERQWSGPNEFREIVQIGAIKIDNFIEIEHLNILVKPKINPALSNYFINLTGISQEQIDHQGINFKAALTAFKTFVGEQSIILSNGGDESIFNENCKIHGIDFNINNNRFVNLSRFFSHIAGINKHIDTCDLIKTFNLTYNQSAHDALSDTRSILVVLNHLKKDKQHFKFFLELLNY